MTDSDPQFRRRTVHGPDGTPLAVDVIGDGPPLVIVHGSISTAADWHPVARALADAFTVHLPNRRGHGPSPDGADYSFDREVDDVAAVLAAAGPGSALFGHSFGGALALSLAADAPPAALIAYEPGIRLDSPIGGESVSLVEEAIARGGAENGLVMGMRRFAGFGEEAIAEARRSPAWEQMVAMAHTWPREIGGLDRLDVAPERFARITSPALLLRGTESPAWLRETTARVAGTVPDARLVEFPGQGHDAHLSDPRLVADRIRAFLDPDRPAAGSGIA